MTLRETRSPTTGARTRITAVRHGGQRRAWPLIVLEVLLAASALYGGAGLIWNNAIAIPDSWLQGSHFSSWVLPGLFLLLVVMAPMTTAVVLELRRSSWSAFASVLAGAALIGWIGAELLVMQQYNVLQPVMMFCGLALVLSALWVHRNVPVLPSSSTAEAALRSWNS